MIVASGWTRQVAGGPGDDSLRGGFAYGLSYGFAYGLELDDGPGADRLEAGRAPAGLTGGEGMTR